MYVCVIQQGEERKNEVIIELVLIEITFSHVTFYKNINANNIYWGKLYLSQRDKKY